MILGGHYSILSSILWQHAKRAVTMARILICGQFDTTTAIAFLSHENDPPNDARVGLQSNSVVPQIFFKNLFNSERDWRQKSC